MPVDRSIHQRSSRMDFWQVMCIWQDDRQHWFVRPYDFDDESQARMAYRTHCGRIPWAEDCERFTVILQKRTGRGEGVTFSWEGPWKEVERTDKTVEKVAESA